MQVGLLDRLKQTNRRSATLIVFGSAGIVLMLFTAAAELGVRLNASPSLPVGLYITSADRTANLVEFCPAEPYASYAAARGYRSRGNCPDGAAPLMKPIVARPGDLVNLSRDGIAVNGHLLPNTSPRASDSLGRPLRAWSFGTYSVAVGTVWVASSYHPRSFDSRYLGPIRTTSIRSHVRPLLTAW